MWAKIFFCARSSSGLRWDVFLRVVVVVMVVLLVLVLADTLRKQRRDGGVMAARWR